MLLLALANFDLLIPKNQFIAFNWQNTQPLLKSKNLSKGAKRDLLSEVMEELKVIVFETILSRRILNVKKA